MISVVGLILIYGKSYTAYESVMDEDVCIFAPEYLSFESTMDKCFQFTVVIKQVALRL